MKSNIKILTILLTLIISTVIFAKQLSAQQSYVSYQVFYDQLSPYGEWVDYPNYGYVWIPDEGSDFVPYSTMGHWLFSIYGWTWVSDYSWGWAPFHYGRWDYDNYYGWFWIPDNEWGPAWVTWRRADGYYGWSPMGPGISISVSFGRQYDRNNDHWMFVRDRDIDRSNLSRHYINRSDNDRIIGNSVVLNNTYVDNRRNATYVTGPERGDIQKVTGRKINPVAIEENTGPGQEMRNGQLRMYRPQVTRNEDNGRRAEPSRVVNLRDVKRPSERTPVNMSGNPNRPDNRRQRQQIDVAPPQNEVKSLPQQNDNRGQSNRREVPQNAVTPPIPQQNDNRGQSNRREVPQNAVTPPIPQQNDNRGENNRREVPQNAVTPPNEVKPIPQQNDNRGGNNRREVPQNAVTPPNEVKPIPQQNANRAGTDRREVQQNAVNQQNNTKSLQNQNENQTRRSRVQNQNDDRAAKKISTEQPKKSRTEKNQKKKNDKGSEHENF